MTELSHTSAEAVRPLAVVTGAASGIGYELGKLLAGDGHDLIVAADTPLAEAIQTFEGLGARVDALEVDLAGEQGVQTLIGKIGGRPVDVLAANAGHGLGKAFLDERTEDILHAIDTHVTGTVRLVHLIGRDMRDRGRGRILFTGSIAGPPSGAFAAIYNACKAFVDSFALALRSELRDTGVTVTVLMPAAADREVFTRPADLARIGYEAMLHGDGDAAVGMGQTQAAAVEPGV